MSDVQVYTSPGCGYCNAAKSLLTARGIRFEAVDISRSHQLAVEMTQRSGRTSVPQIFINNKHIGGFDELRQLDSEGELMPLILN